MPLLHHSYEPKKNKLTYQDFPLTTGPINKSLIANFSGKETSFFFKISPKVVFCTTVPEYGHNSICQKTDLTTFVSQVFNFRNFLEFFRTNFDSLRPRNRKIFAIIFPLGVRRNAFRTLRN